MSLKKPKNKNKIEETPGSNPTFTNVSAKKPSILDTINQIETINEHTHGSFDEEKEITPRATNTFPSKADELIQKQKEANLKL